MAETPHQGPEERRRRPAVPGEDAGVPVDEETREAATPRRAASAEFLVEHAVGSEALLREAMDPANQSLAEALRLSYRVLQVVILVLVVLFVFSGFQTVEEGQSGVLLRWGKILTVDGKQALDQGLKFSRWPYPAGEFVLFNVRNRSADVGDDFWPDLRGRDFQKAVQAATVHQRLRPGRDGSVLTRGGDIAHIRAAASYDIERPERFVYCVEDANDDPHRLDAERLVELALERSVVHLAARRSLQDFVDLADGGEQELHDTAQALLDRVASGIRLGTVETPLDPTPALAIKKAFGDLQEARVASHEKIENARQDARNTLLSTAGSHYRELTDLIGRYEDAYASRRPEAEARLGEVYDRLQSDATSGQVASILSRAESYREHVDATIGLDARRFQSVLEQYRRQPRLVVYRLWQEAYGRIMQRKDAEIFVAPSDGGMLNISLAGSDRVRTLRRKNSVEQREKKQQVEGIDLENPFIPHARDLHEGPGRRLTPEATGPGSGR